MSYAEQHLRETNEIVQNLDPIALEKMVSPPCGVRARGRRLSIVGGGGSAANASHAVNEWDPS